MVSIRPSGKKHVRNYDERVKFYEIVKELASQGDSPTQIRDKLKRVLRTELDLSTISGWSTGKHSPFGRVHQLCTEPIPDLAYLIGVDLGDTSHRNGSWQHDYTTRLRVKDEDFAREFARAASKVLCVRPTAVWLDKKTGLWQTDVNSILLYRFLNRQLEDIKVHIEHCLKCTAAFLRGFFDAESGVGNNDLTVSNGLSDLMIYVQNLLRKYFLIDSTGPFRRGQPPGTMKIIKGRTVRVNMYSYVIRIKSESLLTFEGSIGFTLQRKREALRRLIVRKTPSI